MGIVGKLPNHYFLEPGKMLVDPSYDKDYKPDVDRRFDSWLSFGDMEPHTIEVWLGYKRKPQIKRDRGVFFNEGKYGHALEVMCLYVADMEDMSWQCDYPDYEWIEVGRWDNR